MEVWWGDLNGLLSIIPFWLCKESIIADININKKEKCQNEYEEDFCDVSGNYFVKRIINSLKIPIDIAKSRKDPSFFISAGDKFTTILELGNLYPLFIIADFTRSLDSFILIF